VRADTSNRPSSPAPVAERLLTFRECAERTSTTERLWREIVATGRVRSVKVGKYRRIPESGLAEFIELNTRPATSTRPRSSVVRTALAASAMPLRRRSAPPAPQGPAHGPNAGGAGPGPDAA